MKSLLSLFTLLMGFSIFGQLHVELGPSFQSPSGQLSKVYDIGLGLSVEPRLVIGENMAVGVYAALLGFSQGDLTSSKIDPALMIPILGTATYKMVGAKVSPYVGGGLGTYRLRAASDPSNPQSVKESQSMGYMARAGLLLGRLNLGASYHSAGGSQFVQFGIGFRFGPW